jgi:hypothetical protein
LCRCLRHRNESQGKHEKNLTHKYLLYPMIVAGTFSV